MVFTSSNSFAKVLFDLCKVKITFFVALTTALGFILGSLIINADIIYPVIGIFLLACGAFALN